MKKLIVMFAAVAIAAGVQAATWNWKTSGTAASQVFYGSDGNTLGTATLYLLTTDIVSQSDLLNGIRQGKTISDWTPAKTTTTDSASKLVAVSGFEYGEAANYSFYMAIVDGDDIFISNSVNKLGQASATVDVSFSGIKSATQSTFGDADYTSAGWYSAAAVPEPTSGLLMLLGMAGLALRRRRA